MLDIKAQHIRKVGKCYEGLVCQFCGIPITRKIYDYHMNSTRDFFCSLSCSNKSGKLKDINDCDDWLKGYKTTAPLSCQSRMTIVSCLDCKDNDCTFLGYNP